jgi:putative toxin-antitoxin system antitoxin component (TIGR02293 family)
MNDKLTRATKVDRISELLGLPEDINSTASLTAQVANGLSCKSLDTILNVMFSQPALNIIPDRVYRRAKQEKQSLSPAKSQIVYDFARAYEVADRVHNGNGALVMRFLEKPNPGLGGAIPMSLAISSPAGADAVIELLNS